MGLLKKGRSKLASSLTGVGHLFLLFWDWNGYTPFFSFVTLASTPGGWMDIFLKIFARVVINEEDSRDYFTCW